MNKTKFFIVSIQRDYIVRFHAQADKEDRSPSVLFLGRSS